MAYFSHLECSVPCGAGMYDPRQEHHLCRCGAPLLARYDLEAAKASGRETLATRASNMWRYRELMPLFDGEALCTDADGCQRLAGVSGPAGPALSSDAPCGARECK